MVGDLPRPYATTPYTVHVDVCSVQGADGTIGCEIHPVTRLLLSSAHSGHCSRGDEEAIARGALRCQAASWCSRCSPRS